MLSPGSGSGMGFSLSLNIISFHPGTPLVYPCIALTTARSTTRYLIFFPHIIQTPVPDLSHLRTMSVVLNIRTSVPKCSSAARHVLHEPCQRTVSVMQTSKPISISRSSSLSYATSAKVPSPVRKRIVMGVTGATGTLYAIRMLEILKELNVETHLIFSKWALATIKYETERSFADIAALATKYYAMKDMAAPPSSGSFLHDGMIVLPCSMKTLAAIRSGFCDDLISRSADVCLKERRKLLLAVRETPLSAIHLDNMTFLEKAGARIFPPVPAFYTRPKTIEDMIDQSVGRMLDNSGIHVDNFERWEGFRKDKKE